MRQTLLIGIVITLLLSSAGLAEFEVPKGEVEPIPDGVLRTRMIEVWEAALEGRVLPMMATVYPVKDQATVPALRRKFAQEIEDWVQSQPKIVAVATQNDLGPYTGFNGRVCLVEVRGGQSRLVTVGFEYDWRWDKDAQVFRFGDLMVTGSTLRPWANGVRSTFKRNPSSPELIWRSTIQGGRVVQIE